MKRNRSTITATKRTMSIADSSKESIDSTFTFQWCCHPHLDLMNFTYLAQIFPHGSENGTTCFYIACTKIEMQKRSTKRKSAVNTISDLIHHIQRKTSLYAPLCTVLCQRLGFLPVILQAKRSKKATQHMTMFAI